MSATVLVSEAMQILRCKRTAVHRAIAAGRIRVVARDTTFPGTRLILNRQDVETERKRRATK